MVNNLFVILEKRWGDLQGLDNASKRDIYFKIFLYIETYDRLVEKPIEVIDRYFDYEQASKYHKDDPNMIREFFKDYLSIKYGISPEEYFN